MMNQLARLLMGLFAAALSMCIVSEAKAETSCPGPYHVVAPDGRCVWYCSKGTTPDDKSGECVCQAGLVETGKDQFGRRICEQKPAEPTCEGPYHAVAPDGRCVWSCGKGTTPDDKSGECVCQTGLTETGKDQFGRRVCEQKQPERPDCRGPYHVVAKDGRCVWSCSVGTTPDKKSGECVCQTGLVETGKDGYGRRVCQKKEKARGRKGSGDTICKGPYQAPAADGRCVWSCGEGTEPDAKRGVCVCKRGHSPQRNADQFGRQVCKPERKARKEKRQPPAKKQAAPPKPGPGKAPNER